MKQVLSFDKLEAKIGYNFHNHDLLLEAMSHPSLRQNNEGMIFNYERLELLGDAVLGFVITEILFINFSNNREGELAKIRAYLICGEMICKVADDLNLSEHIIMTQGEENSNGRNNPNNLENATESLIAAIYLDSNIEQVKDIIKKLWSKYLDNIGEFSFYDSKTVLQELSQSHKYDVPVYEVIEKTGSAHDPIFTIKVSALDNYEIAQGKSIRVAQKEAAKKLLNKLNKL